MKHISILIVNYNNHKRTNLCLRSLESISHPSFSYTVLIVDNGSQEIYSLPREFNRKKFQVVRSDANLGFTGGNNLGLHTAIEKFNSDYVVLLNNDTLVDPNFLETLFQAAEDDPSVGLVSPKIYFTKNMEFHSESYKRNELGNVLWYAGGSIDWEHLAAFHRGVDEIDRGQFANQTESDFATGCCVLIRREILEKVGYLDKKYFLYLEDVDLSIRARLFGYSIRYCDKAVIWHDNAGSSGGSGSNFHIYYQLRNRLYFFFQYGSLKTRINALRLFIDKAINGTSLERRALWHVITLQSGKQLIV
ncbi:MAG: glycosyltransferase family 2 protein [Candidatus Pacebacteria bacterium CG10_big_fil_rev_8_21_14_0_10_42_12]|nr:glycosyltransferase family 2 protein [Candidatus Paceibacterota bacterium]PIR62903.1 MAG: glycosyltransferase family 2 protein [Candidatus Pacebacteria bacterium CG10_big_fil_rev_8_21_14_0_10_42_12]